MTEKHSTGADSWVDPDDAPELTEADFARADVYQGETLVKRGRGRPKAAQIKELVSLRLDADVLAGWRRSGSGWQTRINDTLRETMPRAITSRRETKLLDHS